MELEDLITYRIPSPESTPAVPASLEVRKEEARRESQAEFDARGLPYARS